MGKTWENEFVMTMPPISSRPSKVHSGSLVGILSNFKNGKDPVSVSVAFWFTLAYEPFDGFQPNVHRYLLSNIRI